MATIYVRQNIWRLEESQSWHPITLAYARAIAELQQRDADDPTSWSYQAAIHGSHTTPVQPAWNQCQHGGWYFLPWHRIYLYYLERILRSVVVSQGGPEDWALPYWNYDAGGGANTIPIPFREPTLPDGSPNPLYVTERRFGINQGAGLPPEVTSPAAALAMGTYTPPPQPGFGGGQTSFQHFWNTPGGLEQTPHNVIHNAVGGPGGWMTDPNLAALDPIFWLHHANIDRLWSVWLDSAGHADPPDSSWRDQSFELFDESGNQVTMAVAGVLDTVADLDYAYDEAPLQAHAAAAQEVGMADNPDDVAGELTELLGASEESIDLAGETTSVEVALEEETNLAQAWVAAERPERLYLSIEHVDADRDPGVVYGVYVEAPEGPEGRSEQPREHVGNVALFGTRELHEARDEDGPHDLRLVFDVTDVAQRLRERGLGEGALRVTFEPLGLEMPEGLDVTAQAAAGAGAVEEAPVIHIGRVSFFAG